MVLPFMDRPSGPTFGDREGNVWEKAPVPRVILVHFALKKPALLFSLKRPVVDFQFN